MSQQKLIGGILVIIMGLVIIIGSILPWVTATTFLGSISKSGTEGDGKITLVTGIITLLCGIAILASNSYSGWVGLTILACAASVVVAIIDLVDVSNKVGEISSQYVQASPGIGLYIVLVGGIVGGVSSLVSILGGKPAQIYICPYCGGTVNPTANFCPHCGNRLMPYPQ